MLLRTSLSALLLPLEGVDFTLVSSLNPSGKGGRFLSLDPEVRPAAVVALEARARAALSEARLARTVPPSLR